MQISIKRVSTLSNITNQGTALLMFCLKIFKFVKNVHVLKEVFIQLRHYKIKPKFNNLIKFVID